MLFHFRSFNLSLVFHLSFIQLFYCLVACHGVAAMALLPIISFSAVITPKKGPIPPVPTWIAPPDADGLNNQ